MNRIRVVAAALVLASVTTAGARLPYHDGHVHLERDVVYGGEDGPEEATMFLATSFDVDDAGIVYVAEYKLNCIMVFDAAGSLTATIGAEGEGPGDLRGPSIVIRDADGNLIVYEQGNRRLQRLGVEGEHLGTTAVSFPDQISQLAMGRGGYPFATLYVGNVGPPKDPATMALVRLDHDLTVADTLYSMRSQTSVFVPLDDGYWVTMAPFPPGLRWAVLPDGRIVAGSNATPGIEILDPIGSPPLTFTLDGEADPVTPDDEARFLSRFEQDGKSTLEPRYREAIVFPEHKPWFSAILIDGAGNILVRRDHADGDVARFDVFDGAGRYLTRFTTDALPGQIRFRGDAIYALHPLGDELPSIVRWVPSGGPGAARDR